METKYFFFIFFLVLFSTGKLSNELRARLNQPCAMAPREAGRWVAASSNPLRPWFELSSSCANIRCARCSGIASCDFQAGNEGPFLIGRRVMGMRRPESIITMREFIVMNSENQFWLRIWAYHLTDIFCQEFKVIFVNRPMFHNILQTSTNTILTLD